MRQKRAKAYRKLMHVYCMSFGFRQPYQVLVDSEMCAEAVSSKIDLAKQLAVVLQGTVKPMITQCSIHSLYIAGRSKQPVVDLAKTFERRRCNHREAIPEEDCLREVIGPINKHRYVLAAQSSSLRQNIRQVPGTPSVHVKRSVMVLEPASDATEKAKLLMETDRMRPTKAEASTIASTLANSSTVEDSKPDNGVVEPPMKKQRGPKEPNPLSVKKKKPKFGDRRSKATKTNENAFERTEAVGEKRKRSEDDEADRDNGDEKREDTRNESPVRRMRKRVRKRKKLGNEQTVQAEGKGETQETNE